MDRERLVSDVQEGMAFAVRFIPAIVKVRNASARGEEVTLTADEAKGIIEGFKLLKDRKE